MVKEDHKVKSIEDADKLKIRGARDWNEYDIMVDNATEAFNAYNIGRDSFYYTNKYSPAYRLKDTRLAILNGVIIGSLTVLRRKINIRGTSIYSGCIADVHVNSEYRGMGYALKLLENTIEYMKKEGMLVSLLVSEKHGFYGKLGWRSISGVKYILDSETDVFPVPERYKVVKSELGESLNLLKLICETSKEEYSGGVVRNSAYWRSLDKWYFSRDPICYIAYEGKDKVAVCFLKKKKGVMWVNECRNLPGHDESPKNLLKEALIEAKRRKLSCVTGILPETHPIAVKMILLGGRREVENDLMGIVFDSRDLMESFSGLSGEAAEKYFKRRRGVRKTIMESDEFINLVFGSKMYDGSINTKKGGSLYNAFPPEDYVFWKFDRF